MSTYTSKEFLVDLGFIDGYCYSGDFPTDWGMLKALIATLERIENLVITGKSADGEIFPHAASQLLHDIGWVRGLLWKVPIPHAVSEAMSRIIRFVTGDNDFPCRLTDGTETTAEPKEHQLSEHQRDTITLTASQGNDAHSAVFAHSLGASHVGVLDVWRRLGVMTQEEIEEALNAAAPSAAANASAQPTEDSTGYESSPPAAVADIVPDETNQSIPDDQVEEIRQLSETMTDDEVARQHGVSRSTVFRFRQKHGIEKTKGPRTGKTRRKYQWEPWQKNKMIEMKLAGHSYGKIADAVGKTPSQCSGMWFWEKKKREQSLH